MTSAARPESTYAFTKLVVGDLDRTADFYKAVFDYRELQRVSSAVAGEPIEEIILIRGADMAGEVTLVIWRWPGRPAPRDSDVIPGFITTDIDIVFARAEAAGFAVNLWGIAIWPPLLEACRMVGDIAIPPLLLALGVRMTAVRFTDLRVALLIALLRPAAGAVLAWCRARLAGLGEREAAMFLVFGAPPPAVKNFLFAERYAQDPARVASIVLIGNLAAVITLPLSLAIVL